MITERLAALRARFLRRSADDREALLRAVGADPPDRTLVGGLAHRLAGGGGTVGLPAISAAAAALEDACDGGGVEAVRAAAAELCAIIAAEAAAAGP